MCEKSGKKSQNHFFRFFTSLVIGLTCNSINTYIVHHIPSFILGDFRVLGFDIAYGALGVEGVGGIAGPVLGGVGRRHDRCRRRRRRGVVGGYDGIATLVDALHGEQ